MYDDKDKQVFLRSPNLIPRHSRGPPPKGMKAKGCRLTRCRSGWNWSTGRGPHNWALKCTDRRSTWINEPGKRMMSICAERSTSTFIDGISIDISGLNTLSVEHLNGNGMHSKDFLKKKVQIDEFVARDQIRGIDAWRAVLNDLFGQLVLNVLMPRETIGAIGQCCGRRFEARDQGDEDITEQFRR